MSKQFHVDNDPAPHFVGEDPSVVQELKELHAQAFGFNPNARYLIVLPGNIQVTQEDLRLFTERFESKGIQVVVMKCDNVKIFALHSEDKA